MGCSTRLVERIPVLFPPGYHMIDIAALQRALPVCRLEPEVLARITGLVAPEEGESGVPTIDLLEPPAGRRESFVDAKRALKVLFRH